jgi:hypothetical protein
VAEILSLTEATEIGRRWLRRRARMGIESIQRVVGAGRRTQIPPTMERWRCPECGGRTAVVEWDTQVAKQVRRREDLPLAAIGIPVDVDEIPVAIDVTITCENGHPTSDTQPWPPDPT